VQLLVNSILLLVAVIVANLISDRLPVDRFLSESGNPRASIDFVLLVASGLAILIAGFVGSRVALVGRGHFSYRMIPILLLLLGYVLFSIGAPLGVRRFILGTETWRISTHLEHFIRYLSLFFTPVHCIAVGLAFSDQFKPNCWNWTVKTGSVVVSIFLWYSINIQFATTVLFLDLLLERNRLMIISLLFVELVFLGFAVGIASKRWAFDSIAHGLGARLLYILFLMSLLLTMALTIHNGLGKVFLYGQQSSWLNGFSLAGYDFDDEMSNSLCGLLSILLLAFLTLYSLLGIFISIVRFMDAGPFNSSSANDIPIKKAKD
jgi:hypothetical protein